MIWRPIRVRHWAAKLLLIAAVWGLIALPAVSVQAQGGTINDLLSLGANTVREVQETIPLLQGAIQETMQSLVTQLESLLETISQTYQENLSVTLSSLDTFTREKFTDLENLLDRVNDKLQEDVQLISQEAQTIIRAARDELEQLASTLQESLSSVIIVGGETAAFVVDRTFHNAIVLISLLILGLGLVAFVWSLFRRGLPQGGLTRTLLLAFMGIFIVLFGSIALVPSVRAFVMTNTGLGLKQRLEKDQLVGQPKLLRVNPDQFSVNTLDELEIWGSSLLVNNAPPTAKIGTQTVTVKSFQSDLLVLDVSSLSVNATGTLNIVLTYPDNVELRGSVRIGVPTATPAPADLIISAMTFQPSQPQEGQTITANVTVTNQGGNAGASTVKWFPCADLASVEKKPVPALVSGQSLAFTFTFTFTSARTNCQMQAVADFDNQITESNEANNLKQTAITVRAGPTRTPVPTTVPSRIFTVTVTTGDEFGAGTNANVFITLIGADASSGEATLDTASFDDFERNTTTNYTVDAGRNIGAVRQIRLRHDNTGVGPGWFVGRVVVRNNATGEQVTFNINRWFARDEDDGSIDRTLTP